jgi:hypothetical protein
VNLGRRSGIGVDKKKRFLIERGLTPISKTIITSDIHINRRKTREGDIKKGKPSEWLD